LEKYRIQFDLTAEALQRLDEIKEKAKAGTRAEAVRNALRLYAWYLSKKSEGYQLLLRKDSDLKEIEIIGIGAE
jgi:metal-responsive CopG/Arc/MetJ family transcriptional regulator